MLYLSPVNESDEFWHHAHNVLFFKVEHNIFYRPTDRFYPPNYFKANTLLKMAPNRTPFCSQKIIYILLHYSKEDTTSLASVQQVKI